MMLLKKIAECENDIKFSGADATEFSSAKAALLGLSEPIIYKTPMSSDDAVDAWFKGPDSDSTIVFPEDAVRSKLVASTNRSNRSSLIEKIGLIAQAEALLSTVTTPGQVDILRSSINKAKGEILLQGVDELRKDVMKDIRTSDGISAKRHIAKAVLLTELMSEGSDKRNALQKIASAQKAFSLTSDSDDSGTKNFKINTPDDDGDSDELDDNVFTSGHKPLLVISAFVGLLASLAALVVIYQDEVGSALSTVKDSMSERFVEPADRAFDEFSVWFKNLGKSSESEKTATHKAVGILDDALKTAADKTGGDMSSLSPILSGGTAPGAKLAAPAKPAAEPVAKETLTSTLTQIDTVLIHFKYTDDGKVIATGKMDFENTTGSLRLIDRNFTINNVSYIKLEVTQESGKSVEILVLSPSEVPKEKALAHLEEGFFKVPVFTRN